VINEWRALPRSAHTLLLGVLLTSITTFMLIPLLALHLTRSGQSIAAASFVVMVLTVTQQVAALFVGIGVDRWGAGRSIGAGLALRVLGYVLLGGAPRTATDAVGAALIGLGAAMITIGILAMLGAAEDAGRRSIFALRGMFVNVGAVLGPLLGGLAIQASFDWIIAAATMSHLLFAILLCRDRPRTSPSAMRKPSPFRGIRRIMRSRDALVGMIGKGLFWLFYCQITLTVPLYVTNITGTRATIVYLYVINGIIVIVFQYPLIRIISQKASSGIVVGAGLLSYALSYAALGVASGLPSLLVFILLATLGEMILGPITFDAVLRGTPDELRGTALGMASLWASFGSMLGTFGGGNLYQHIPAVGRQSYWVVLASLAALGATAVVVFSRPPAPQVPEARHRTRRRGSEASRAATRTIR
jgi:MFS family permease